MLSVTGKCDKVLASAKVLDFELVSFFKMTSHRNYQWLRNLITGDEKWVLYINCTHKRQWLSPGQTGVATPKVDLHPKKVMLSVW